MFIAVNTDLLAGECFEFRNPWFMTLHIEKPCSRNGVTLKQPVQSVDLFLISFVRIDTKSKYRLLVPGKSPGVNKR